jgi:hypothetical protein
LERWGDRQVVTAKPPLLGGYDGAVRSLWNSIATRFVAGIVRLTDPNRKRGWLERFFDALP